MNTETPTNMNQPTSEEKTMGMLCHLLIIFTFFLGPLIIWLIKKDESAFVNDQGKEALNFGISVSIGMLIPFVNLIVGIYMIVMAIIACMQANQGVAYRYPITLRFIK